MSNRRDIQFTYNPHNKATLLDCTFTVASTDASGTGISNLNASGRIANVYMKTSATKAAGSPGGSTGPASGLIVVQLQDNYNSHLGSHIAQKAPLSGSDVVVTAAGAHLTIGNIYVITLVGTSTAANWITLGVPANITPAVGVAFIAAATGAGTGSGTVQTPATAASGVFSIQQIGVHSNSTGAYTLGNGNGTQLMYACYADSAADAPVLTAPADGTVIRMLIYMNNSAQGV